MERPPWWQSTTVLLLLSSSSPLRILGPLMLCLNGMGWERIGGVNTHRPEEDQSQHTRERRERGDAPLGELGEGQVEEAGALDIGPLELVRLAHVDQLALLFGEMVPCETDGQDRGQAPHTDTKSPLIYYTHTTYLLLLGRGRQQLLQLHGVYVPGGAGLGHHLVVVWRF